MNVVIVQAAISGITFVLSVAASMFVAGSRWGRIEGKIETMADRLAKIEGMFTLRLRDDEKK